MRPKLVWGDLIVLPYCGRRWGCQAYHVLNVKGKYADISHDQHTTRIKHTTIPEGLILYDSPDSYEDKDDFVGDWFGLYPFGSEHVIYVCRSKRTLAYARDVVLIQPYRPHVIRLWKPNA